jgi:hypothetical protein
MTPSAGLLSDTVHKSVDATYSEIMMTMATHANAISKIEAACGKNTKIVTAAKKMQDPIDLYYSEIDRACPGDC